MRARRSQGECWSQRASLAEYLSFSSRFPEQNPAMSCLDSSRPAGSVCGSRPDTGQAFHQGPAHAHDHHVTALITQCTPVFTQGNGGWRTAPPISITMLSNLVVRYLRPPGSGPCPRSPRHCTDHAGRARQSGLLNRPGSRLLSGFQQASWRTVQGTLTATHPFSLYL